MDEIFAYSPEHLVVLGEIQSLFTSGSGLGNTITEGRLVIGF
jgi:hypothetical protein